MFNYHKVHNNMDAYEAKMSNEWLEVELRRLLFTLQGKLFQGVKKVDCNSQDQFN